MAGKRRKPKRKAGLGYIIVLLVILIIFLAAGVFVSKRFAPSKTQADLRNYYNLTAYGDMVEAKPNEMAIIINHDLLDSSDTEYFRAVKEDGGTYVALSLIQGRIDNRFYYDSYENKVIITNAVESIVVPVDGNVYYTDGNEVDAGYTIAKTINDNVYMNMDFVSAHSSASSQTFTNPDRVLIQNEWIGLECCTTTSAVKMRTTASKKSPIICTVDKGQVLKIISKKEGWYGVIDEKGYLGFVQSSAVTDPKYLDFESGYTEPEYTHLLMDEKINMTWHGIYYFESNQYIGEYTRDMTGVNVLAPTWFLFADSYGNLTSYAEASYVEYAHEKGCKVWAVLEDLDGLAGSEVIPYTSSRRNAINQMIEQCLAYGIDGINVDLESIGTEQGNDFIQFIRELSVECRKNKLVLSVCDYAPYSYNAYRHTEEQSKIADYVCIMAYDDYVGANEAGPNAGLPFIKEVMSLCESTVDMNRLIVGIPFYTRVWYERTDGTLGAETLDMAAAENLTLQYGLEFEWQPEVGYDFASYEDWNSTAKIWKENAKSIEAKLQVLTEYNIAGIASWRLGQETSDVWSVISKYY